jgi:hypothetical protein
MKKGLRDNKKAVSAIVTFVLLTTVALVFIGNWLNVAVPEWGSEDEERHMIATQNQLVGVRASAKGLIYADNTDFVIPNYLKLGTPGAAWKGVGRANGDLIFDPLESTILCQNESSNLVATKGNMVYQSHNLYYPDQSLIFESGAVIKQQDGGAAMVAPPDFGVSLEGNVITVRMTLISLTGDSDTISGNLGVIIYTKLVSREYNWYNWTTDDEDLVINIDTQYPDAWITYFQTTLPRQGFTEVTGAAVPDEDGEFKVHLTATGCVLSIANVDEFESTVAVVDIWFG